ncbi:hypothetical protein HDU97_007020 [Phlyctochytrium planicorne]|nr:hypothetical protein HDU97_007020 [Phlyctochytrium planicorne]
MSAAKDCKIFNDIIIELIGPQPHQWECCGGVPGFVYCGVVSICTACDTSGRIVIVEGKSSDLTDSFPFSKLSNLTELRVVDLSNNQIQTFPEALTSLQHLEELKLGNNHLTGLPEAIGSLRNLTTLDLNRNKLTGSIPTSIGQLQQLRYLDLSYNQLTGPLPDELGYVQNLTTLRLHDNIFNSSIPETFGNLAKIEELTASNAGITGNLPKTPPGVAALASGVTVAIDLSVNQITGRIPDDWAKLVCPTCKLSLSENRLTGDIPSTVLAAMKEMWHKTSYIDLQSNYLTGPPYGNDIIVNTSFISFDYSSRLAAAFNCFKWPIIDFIHKLDSRNKTEEECEAFLGTASTTVATTSTPFSTPIDVRSDIPTDNDFIINTVKVPNRQVTTSTVSRIRTSSGQTDSILITVVATGQPTEPTVGPESNPAHSVNLVVLIGTSIVILLATLAAVFAMGVIYGRKARTKLERVASSSSSQLEQSQIGRTSHDGSDVSSGRQARSAVSDLEPDPRVRRRELWITSPIHLGQSVEHQDLYDHSLEVPDDDLPKDDQTKPQDLKEEIEE